MNLKNEKTFLNKSTSNGESMDSRNGNWESDRTA